MAGSADPTAIRLADASHPAIVAGRDLHAVDRFCAGGAGSAQCTSTATLSARAGGGDGCDRRGVERPALSGAAARLLTEGLDRVDAVEIAISAWKGATAGSLVVAWRPVA